MKRLLYGITLAFSFAATAACGQAFSTASRKADLSVFSGITLTKSGIGKSYSLQSTLVADSVLRTTNLFRIATEVRAAVPLSSSDISESSIAGGLRFERPVTKALFAVNAAYGRAQLNYRNGGMVSADKKVLYTSSTSGIYMLGASVALPLTSSIDLRVDQQFERLSLPVVASKHAIAMPLTIGLSFHFPYTRNGFPY